MMFVLMIDVEGGKEGMWNSLTDVCTETEGDIEPLYATRCITHGDISLIMNVKDADELPKFINTTLKPLGGLRDIWMFTMVSPRFFRLPSLIPDKVYPFTVTIDALTQKYDDIYETLTEIKPIDNVIPTYISYTFQSFEDDIVMSMLAPDIFTVDQFVIDHIRSIDGIFDTKTYAISKSKILTPLKNWRRYINKWSYTREDIVSEDTKEEDLKSYTIAF